MRALPRLVILLPLLLLGALVGRASSSAVVQDTSGQTVTLLITPTASGVFQFSDTLTVQNALGQRAQVHVHTTAPYIYADYATAGFVPSDILVYYPIVFVYDDFKVGLVSESPDLALGQLGLTLPDGGQLASDLGPPSPFVLQSMVGTMHEAGARNGFRLEYVEYKDAPVWTSSRFLSSSAPRNKRHSSGLSRLSSDALAVSDAKKQQQRDVGAASPSSSFRLMDSSSLPDDVLAAKIKSCVVFGGTDCLDLFRIQAVPALGRCAQGASDNGFIERCAQLQLTSQVMGQNTDQLKSLQLTGLTIKNAALDQVALLNNISTYNTGINAALRLLQQRQDIDSQRFGNLSQTVATNANTANQLDTQVQSAFAELGSTTTAIKQVDVAVAGQLDALRQQVAAAQTISSNDRYLLDINAQTLAETNALNQGQSLFLTSLAMNMLGTVQTQARTAQAQLTGNQNSVTLTRLVASAQDEAIASGHVPFLYRLARPPTILPPTTRI